MKNIKFIFLIISLMQFGCNESFDSTYSNYDEIIKDSAILRGWIPKEIPHSAVEIKEWHELDNNVGCGSFIFNKNEIEQFLQQLEKLEQYNKLEFRCFVLRKEWHNTDNVRNYLQLLEQGYKMHKTDEFVFAINLEFCRVYFWNLSSIIKEV